MNIGATWHGNLGRMGFDESKAKNSEKSSGLLEAWTPEKRYERPLSEGGVPFSIESDYMPAGDQPRAISELIAGLKSGEHDQVLLGVTGSGKTFTVAQVIQELQRPAIMLAPNKTLAAQLYGEMKSFFPKNAVEYFVSYYDYYQPEAYVPRSDTYIEKDASINEQIDRMRHSATRALLERDDVIIVASVSCIYGIGSVESYSEMVVSLQVGQLINPRDLLKEFRLCNTGVMTGIFNAVLFVFVETRLRSSPLTSKIVLGALVSSVMKSKPFTNSIR